MRPQVRSISFLVDDANSIAEDQTTAGADTLTLDGALVTSGVAILTQITSPGGFRPPRTNDIAMQVTLEGSGNNSGVAFTLTGTDADGKAIIETRQGGNAVAVTTVLFFKTVSAITVNGAVTGNIEVGWLRASGGVTSSIYYNYKNPKVGINVKLDALQQIIITSAGDDSSIIFVIVGEDNAGVTVSERLAGTNTLTARSAKFYAKINSIETVGNAGTVTSGTDSDADGIAQSQNPADGANLIINGALAAGGVAFLTAAMTYTADHTSDDIQKALLNAVWLPTDDIESLTATGEGNLTFPARAIRLRLSAYTSGRGTITVTQESTL